MNTKLISNLVQLMETHSLFMWDNWSLPSLHLAERPGAPSYDTVLRPEFVAGFEIFQIFNYIGNVTVS